MDKKWTCWIDCGGTFTDIIAVNGQGDYRVHKVLSHSPRYKSAVVHGIKEILETDDPSQVLAEVRLGTTVATNAFLERKGLPCALMTTLGHRDVLQIRQQNRPDLFAIDIEKIPPLYHYVTHANERINAQGEVLVPLDREIVEFELERILEEGITSLAISFLHATINPMHEKMVKEMALEMGFDYVVASHEVSPLAKYISRTETAVLDSYLSPFLRQYTQELEEELGIEHIYYMQSDGTLSNGDNLLGYNSLLSGPAGGLVGAIEVAKEYGLNKMISFDMGGTSTDVALYDGEVQIDSEPNFHGLNLLAPMVAIHTVAAGGGSLLKYDQGRFMVGPQSAGAQPGPACYRGGGPLTVTDANLFLERIDPDKFPKVFGSSGKEGLDRDIVAQKFEKWAKEIGLSAKEVAQGFIDVAVETMAQAIRKISIEAGHDPQDFAMVSFGGAGGQLALKVVETLNIKTVLIHPLSSVLSAYGIGKADHALTLRAKADSSFEILKKQAKESFPFKDFEEQKYYLMKAKDSEHIIQVKADGIEQAKKKFGSLYQRTFSLTPPKEIYIDSLAFKAIRKEAQSLKLKEVEELQVKGPKILSENNTAIAIEKDWLADHKANGLWVLQHQDHEKVIQKRDPKIELEIFYQRFQFIAEQMGLTLKKIARSVNIKERNDFSCALFTKEGNLIANAPHIPVHLGSMGDAVKTIVRDFSFQPGDSFICNSPQYGGTHLPDVTVITPIFKGAELIMWTASRGHHADLGGISPGSMPGHSKLLEEEGILIEPTVFAHFGEIDRQVLRDLLLAGPYPVRNIEVNLHDIEAKLAANLLGAKEILNLEKRYSQAYLEEMSERLLDYSCQKTKEILSSLGEIKVTKKITEKRQITVQTRRDLTNQKVIFNYEGTSSFDEGNFNAPVPVVKATVMFALRSMITENIPLNSGLMRAIEIVLPKDCLLNPPAGRAVVAGNVETSQALCDLLFEVLGLRANSQGTMNNLSFGDDNYQYYETLGGGCGASRFKDGASAVQVNMTNSLLTDPEVLESRFPVLVELMGLRHGSGGHGQQRGGDGLYRRIQFLQEMEVSMLSQGREIAPQGLAGGDPALRGLNQWEDATQFEELGECFLIRVPRAGRLSVSTPGGGGYGEKIKDQGNLVFSFGSNMDLLQMKKRCPSAQIVTRAKVHDVEIRYSLHSENRKGGVADMFKAPGKKTFGLIFSLNDDDLEKLDQIECGLNAYQRIEVEAFDDNGRSYRCYAYDVIDKNPDIAPTKIYEWLVYSGAYYLNVPHSYLERLKSYR
jgi:5-oxoprolinase (ATP-hydrolysing)